jgi:hypothetical protein
VLEDSDRLIPEPAASSDRPSASAASDATRAERHRTQVSPTEPDISNADLAPSSASSGRPLNQAESARA